jgi:adenylate cyclase
MCAEGFKRKITAIMSSDVVGYSKLMGDDEAATVKTMEAYRFNILQLRLIPLEKVR